MFSKDMKTDASVLLAELRSSGMKFAAAESCTGGLICGVLTEVAGSSDVVDRGFVTYSNEAKIEMLGVPAALIEEHGAVSEVVACAMVVGVLGVASQASIAVAVTGIAGPGGGSAEKPVGLVYVAAARRGCEPVSREFRFGEIGRSEVRLDTVKGAFQLVREVVRARD